MTLRKAPKTPQSLAGIFTLGIGTLLAGALIAGPIMAQQQDRGSRPSRECMREVRDLCGQGGRPDREQIRACLQEKADELSSTCSAEFQARTEQRRSERRSRPYQATARITRTVIYGSHSRQQIDIYEPADAVEPLPMVLFIHGGGWSMGDRSSVQAKPAHFGASDYYFASAGYRVLPDAPVEQQAADIGAAIAALRGQAGAIGFDPDRIVLMGHSSGAHLAALVASDPSYTGAADGAFDAIRGVILLDGAGYDIAAHIAGANPRSWQLYNNVFGRDPARHAALSPITHVGGRDAPRWLALYVEERETARVQSQALVNALIETGSEASALPVSGTDHGRMNREIGSPPGAEQTAAIDAFLESLF